MPTPPALGPATGTVLTFDDAKGYGQVQGDDGVARFFHCTSIADGSRTIEVGTAVSYDVVAGRLGTWEAVDVRPVS